MSQITELFEGKITVEQFVEGVGNDIKKDTAFLGATPFGQEIEGWAINALSALLATKLSPTLVALIIAEIKNVVGLDPAPTSPVEYVALAS